MTIELKCPHCGNQSFTDYGDGLIACQSCSTQFDLSKHQCPYCDNLLPQNAYICLKCGTDLRGDLARRIIQDRLMTPEERQRARYAPAQPEEKDRVEEESLKCPHCGSKSFTDYGDGLIACQQCHAQFDLGKHGCPHCGNLLAQGVFVCQRCGTDLRGTMARRTIQERLMTGNDWRRIRNAQYRQVRAEQEKDSQQRLDAWWQDEYKRREIENQEKAARQRRERRFVIIALIAILLVAIFVAIASIIFLSSNPEPTPAAWLIPNLNI